MERTEPRWIKAEQGRSRAPSVGPTGAASGLRRAARAPAATLLLLGFLLFFFLVSTSTQAAAPTSLPSDGSVAFLYSKSDSVTGCSQRTEVQVRDLVTGVVHLDPFVPAGNPAPFTLRVEVQRQAAGLVRAAFSLYDKDGGALGTSAVEDASCDGAHLKLAASIALLLQPSPGASPRACPPCPEAGCDPACRTAVRIALREEVTRQTRAEELPRLRKEVEEELAKRVAPSSDWHAGIGGGALFGLNYAADPAPGFWLSGEARTSMWSVGLEVRALFATRAFERADGSSVDVRAVSGLLVPCLRWRWIGGCALVELGGVGVTGPGAGDDDQGVVFSLGVRARLDVPLLAGIEARLFGDVVGHVIGLSARGTDTTGAAPTPYDFDAPRRVSALVGLGLARSF